MRNSSSAADVIDLRRKTSASQLSNSFASSKNSFLNYSSVRDASLRKKGYSFGTSPRKSLMSINLLSPAAKYNIKGIVEINLDKKKGAAFGTGRQDSVQKTPLSYLNDNLNPGPGAYNNQSFYKSSSSIKIGHKNNESLKVQFLNEKAINKNPGPGSYQVKVVKLKGGKLPTQSKRFDKHNKQNQPGPGAYNLADSDVISKGTKISLKPSKM